MDLDRPLKVLLTLERIYTFVRMMQSVPLTFSVVCRHRWRHRWRQTSSTVNISRKKHPPLSSWIKKVGAFSSVKWNEIVHYDRVKVLLSYINTNSRLQISPECSFIAVGVVSHHIYIYILKSNMSSVKFEAVYFPLITNLEDLWFLREALMHYGTTIFLL